MIPPPIGFSALCAAGFAQMTSLEISRKESQHHAAGSSMIAEMISKIDGTNLRTSAPARNAPTMPPSSPPTLMNAKRRLPCSG